MRFCLKHNQNNEYANKADALYIPFKDMTNIYDLAVKYSNKDFLLSLMTKEQINWREIEKLNTLCQGNDNKLILVADNTNLIEEACLRQLNSYWGYPVTTFSDIEGIMSYYINHNQYPEYFYLGAPLTHNIQAVSKFFENTKVKLIVSPNTVNTDGLEHNNNAAGSWIRPEDIDFYGENGINMCIFAAEDTKEEQALYRIYAEQKQWAGKLNILIKDLKSEANNRLIKPEISRKRISCRQMCLENGSCRLCKRVLDLADLDAINEYIASKK